LVTAVFYGFSPSRVARAVPGMWELVSPARALELRASVVDTALRRLLGAFIGDPMMSRAAELASRAADGADLGGRPLAAANAAVNADGDPHLLLWQSLTTLREHRGDDHIAALMNAEVDPCAAHVLRASAGAADAEFLRTSRGWSEEEWADATDRMRTRGWVSGDGLLTEAGRQVRDAYESDTDRLAARPFQVLGADRTDELYGLLLRLAITVVEGGGVPVERGLGSPWPPS
jgi:hypothetical protein